MKDTTLSIFLARVHTNHHVSTGTETDYSEALHWLVHTATPNRSSFTVMWTPSQPSGNGSWIHYPSNMESPHCYDLEVANVRATGRETLHSAAIGHQLLETQLGSSPTI